MDPFSRACPDHPCDRCSICAKGRCCGGAGDGRLQAKVQTTTEQLLTAMQANRAALELDRVEATADDLLAAMQANQAAFELELHFAEMLKASDLTSDDRSTVLTATEAIRLQWEKTLARWRAEREAEVASQGEASGGRAPAEPTELTFGQASTAVPALPPGVELLALPPASPNELDMLDLHQQEGTRHADE